MNLTVNTLEAGMYKDRQDITSVTVTGCREIPERCFEECVNLTKVTVQGNLGTINYNAFKGCESLEVFSAPDAKELNICGQAFQGCSSLRRFDCFYEVNRIAFYAFEGCWSLEIINLGPSLDTLAKSAFWNCDLSHLTITGNTKYYVKDGFIIEHATIDDIYSNRSTSVMRALYYLTDDKEIVIPSEVERLSDMCFKGHDVRTITLPPGIKSFNDIEATDDHLTAEECGDVKGDFCCIPGDYTMLLQDPFYKCKSLEVINVNEENPTFVSIDGVLYSKDHRTLYRVPPARKGVFEVPEGVMEIHDYAFSGCAVTTVKLPVSVREIGYAAFRSGPQHVEVADGNPKFVKRGQQMVYEQTERGNGVLFCDKTVSRTFFSMNIQFIREYAFENCCEIKYFRCPLDVRKIGGYAFAGCTSLQKVFLPPFLEHIESGLFERCTSLEYLVCPTGCLKTIGGRILAGCSQLVTIAIRSNGVLVSEQMYENTNCGITYDISFKPNETSPNDLFDYDNIRGFFVRSSGFPLGCTDSGAVYEGMVHIGQKKATPSILLRVPSGVETFKIPASCFFIQSAAFYYCPKLEEIFIPDTVKIIMENAIGECACKVLRLPEDITIIAKDVYNTQYKVSAETAKRLVSQCEQLERIVIGDKEYPINKNK